MSTSNLFTVHYNAFRTEEATFLVALGWTNHGGMNPRLEVEEQKYIFKADEGGIATDVLEPFCVSCQIDGDPRSIHVEDPNGRHHVQVCGLEAVGPSHNKGGAWVLSKEAV